MIDPKDRKPLERRTPLKRSAPMKRVAPKMRAAALNRPQTAPKRARETGFPVAVRVTIDVRDGGRCVSCGKRATNVQHRIARGMGGTHDPRVSVASNGISLCGSGTTGCHGWFEINRRAALLLGYAISKFESDPASEIPVLTRDGWQLFDDEGNRTPCPPFLCPFTPGEPGWPCLPG